ncbi:MAG TPA: tetratricopeptide repeat protein [Nitrospiraceae bacterium]|nr:tetratricopeptide repeat protein [Nitrospiraceae bacterium]
MIGDYSAADLRRILRIDDKELRTCLRAALLPVPTRTRPRVYSFQNLVVLRTAKGLREAGISTNRIRKVLESLKRQLGGDRAISSIKVYASGRRVVVWDGTLRWQPDSGQFLLNFDAADILPTRSLTPRARPRPNESGQDTAEAWFARAFELQADSREEAERAYLQAIRLRPSFVEAHINLGLLYHEMGDLTRAEQCYRRALHYRPELALAHFNLGVILEDQHDEAGAIAAYEQAVAQDPRFKQAHCHLAELYEKAGKQRDALRHYAAAKRLR